jgi:hypothetical protein
MLALTDHPTAAGRESDPQARVRTALCGLRIPTDQIETVDHVPESLCTLCSLSLSPAHPDPVPRGHTVGRVGSIAGGSELPGAGLAGDAAPRAGPADPQRAGFRVAGASRGRPSYHHDPAPPRPRLSRPVPSPPPPITGSCLPGSPPGSPCPGPTRPPHHRCCCPDRHPRRTDVLVPPARAPRRDPPRDRPAPHSPHPPCTTTPNWTTHDLAHPPRCAPALGTHPSHRQG